MRVIAIIPALDEEGAIGQVVAGLDRGLVQEVIVVDNGSRDRTAQRAAAAGARVVAEPRQGYGRACLAGVQAAAGADMLVFLDGDGSDVPEDLPRLLAPLLRGEADLVLGSRILGRRQAWALAPHQVWGNRAVLLLLRLLYGVRLSDFGSFRAIRADSLMALGMSHPTYGWPIEMVAKAARRGLRIVEVPVEHRRRIGHSKVAGTVRGSLLAGYHLVATVLRYARECTPPLPTTLYFEVTNRCNLPCQTCVRTFNLHEPERDPLTRELKQAAGALPNLRRAVLHGIGEPLLNKHLPEMIRFAKAQGAWVLFNTNGVLLDPRWQEALIDAGLDELRVSLDAATPETFRRIRGAPVFHRIVENLREFVARKRARGVSHPTLSLWMVALRDNLHELPALVDLAADLGIPQVYFQRLVYNGLGVAQREQSLHGQAEGAVRAIIEEAEARGRARGVSLRASGATSPLESLRLSDDPRPWAKCQRPWTSTYVTAHGKVLPCCIAPFAHADFPELILGDLKEEPLEAIWHGERYRRFRQRLASDDPHPCCRTCGVGWSL